MARPQQAKTKCAHLSNLPHKNISALASRCPLVAKIHKYSLAVGLRTLRPLKGKWNEAQ